MVGNTRESRLISMVLSRLRPMTGYINDKFGQHRISRANVPEDPVQNSIRARMSSTKSKGLK